MAISKQFKSLNLNPQKLRKLCIDEVGGVKMKKNEKKKFCNSKNHILFVVLFWLLLWLCIKR
jgi:hypothetical protein